MAPWKPPGVYLRDVSVYLEVSTTARRSERDNEARALSTRVDRYLGKIIRIAPVMVST